MAGKDIAITGKDGSFGGYLATPGSGKGPGVVVIQEIFGINPWVRSVTDWYASQGYMALALDLFWRIKPGVQLDPTKEAEFKTGLEYYNKFSVDKGVEDIQTTISTLRTLAGCTGKVGNLGFCLGGLLSYLAAARTDTDASASYYGGGINTKLAEAAKIKKPTLIHLAGSDDYIPAPAQEEIKEGVKGNQQIAVHVYAGTAHGFCRDIDPKHYDAPACKLAHGRTVELFKRALA
ncbi:MAG: dienelactone hydrolase family protein [Rhodospirillaceae bacterium]|nr:dienelactone hydrolase family protein [Rhodospirillaceae bacterium]